MIGVLANSLAVVVGGLLGTLLRGGIGEKYKQTINIGLALCVIIIGITGAIKTAHTLLIIVSIVLGSIAGEALRIEHGIEHLGDLAQKAFAKGDNSFSAGFVNASLMFCVGSMAVVGSLEAGLMNKPDTLLAKAVIDGVASVIFASTLGVGVCFAAVPLLIYQGGIALLAGTLSPVLTDEMVQELSAVGSLLIIGIGLNMLDFMKQRIRVGNMLPAVFVPCLWFIISGLIGI